MQKSLRSIEKYKTIGERIKACRELSKLTRPAFERKYNISKSSINSYENGFKNPSDDRLKELTKIFQSENVSVSYQWIKNGTGKFPTVSNTSIVTKNNFNNIIPCDSIQLMVHEEQNIKHLYPEVLIATVNTFDLEPIVTFGDRVSGIPISLDNIDNLINKLCIIKTNRRFYVKIISKVNSDKSINIVGSNHYNSDEEFFIPNIIPTHIAPVFWIRKNPDEFN